MVSTTVIMCFGTEETNMKNKILATFGALFLIGVVSLMGVWAYRGDPQASGPNYDATVQLQLEAAMADGNYDAWIKIRQDNNLPMNGKVFQVINKDNFNKFVELHNANLAGDTAKADAIRAELGLGQGQMKRGSDNMGATKSSGNGQRTQRFVDADKDGICDHSALRNA
jgi:hypothetical protein